MLKGESKKKITVTLSQELVHELDLMVKKEKVERSEVIMEATQQFLKEKKAIEMRDKMEKGYTEMATINFDIACECTHLEEEAEDKNMSTLGG